MITYSYFSTTIKSICETVLQLEIECNSVLSIVSIEFQEVRTFIRSILNSQNKSTVQRILTTNALELNALNIIRYVLSKELRSASLPFAIILNGNFD